MKCTPRSTNRCQLNSRQTAADGSFTVEEWAREREEREREKKSSLSLPFSLCNERQSKSVEVLPTDWRQSAVHCQGVHCCSAGEADKSGVCCCGCRGDADRMRDGAIDCVQAYWIVPTVPLPEWSCCCCWQNEDNEADKSCFSSLLPLMPLRRIFSLSPSPNGARSYSSARFSATRWRPAPVSPFSGFRLFCSPVLSFTDCRILGGSCSGGGVQSVRGCSRTVAFFSFSHIHYHSFASSTLASGRLTKSATLSLSRSFPSSKAALISRRWADEADEAAAAAVRQVEHCVRGGKRSSFAGSGKGMLASTVQAGLMFQSCTGQTLQRRPRRRQQRKRPAAVRLRLHYCQSIWSSALSLRSLEARKEAHWRKQ